MLTLIKKSFKFYLEVVFNEIYERQKAKYTIVSDYYNNKEKLFYATLTLKGLAKPITKKVKDIYNKEWLENIRSEDAARLAFLSYVENSGNFEIYHNFPHKKKPE